MRMWYQIRKTTEYSIFPCEVRFQEMIRFRKIVVGLSGGVDSAVAALILKKKGYNVQGVFMENWDLRDESGVCALDQDFEDAQYVCSKLNIPLKKINFVKEYWTEVFSRMIDEYKNGCTPNPDVLCNKFVKFNHFFTYAFDALKADAVATGHYARTTFGPFLENYQENCSMLHPLTDVKLLQPLDNIKDQTLFLSQVNQIALRRTMFPLGDLIKADVKQIAKKNNLEKVANKAESMGICFIGHRNFQSFIEEYVDNSPGNFIDIDSGRIVGIHNGIHQWTVGQRARVGGVSTAYFVARKDKHSKDILVAAGTDHPAFHSSLFFTSKPHWIDREPTELLNKEVYNCQFRFQNLHALVDCSLFATTHGLVVLLKESKRALTKGQYAVFYKNKECLGSAKISHQGPSDYSLLWLQNHRVQVVSKLSRDCNT